MVYYVSKKPEISLQTFEVGLVMAAVMMRVTAVTLIIQLPVAPSVHCKPHLNACLWQMVAVYR